MTARLQLLANQLQKQQIERSVLMGQVAWELSQLWQQAKRQKKNEVILKMFLSEAERIEQAFPKALQQKGDIILSKQQPSLSEAIKETAKRLLFVETFLDHLPDSVQGIALGGSVAYGPFYNVRGLPNASDLDIFCIVDFDFFMGDDPIKFISPQTGFSREYSETFYLRTRIFQKLYKQEKATLMSLKTVVNGYTVSIKFLPCKTFVDEFDTGLAKVLAKDEDVILGIKDYKQGPYFTLQYTQYSFAHKPYTFIMDEEYPEKGAITNLPQLIIHKGYLHTGQHHNHFIPTMEICYDRDGLTAQTFKKFKHHLLNRLRKEREKSIDPDSLSVINALDRKPLLSQQMLDFAQQSFV